MRASFIPLLTIIAILPLGCGDDGGGTDSGTDSATPDTSTGDTGTTDTGTGDTGMAMDSATDTGGGVTCFPLSVPTPELPDALDVTLDETSASWMRPTGEVCPATGSGDEAVPWDSICYTNDTGEDITFTFEVAGSDDPAPAAVIYDGMMVPADSTQCAAISSDLVIDVAEATYTVSAGESVTLVGTFQTPGSGDVQFIVTPE
jgi:hypothetical protein